MAKTITPAKNLKGAAHQGSVAGHQSWEIAQNF
jgi:hypothetical protein